MKTDIAIGFPPQRFTVTLDTGYDGPLLVPGVGCLDSKRWGCYDPDGRLKWAHRYDHSKSKTYDSNGTPSQADFQNYKYAGFLSNDDIWLPGLKLKHASFEEWERLLCMRWDCTAGGFDGVFPLTPPWLESQASCPLHTMLERGMLAEPVFSLSLPNAFKLQSELILGSSQAPHRVSEPTVIQIREQNSSENPIRDFWPIQYNGFEFDNFNQEFPNMTAIVISSVPWIIMPEWWGHKLNDHIGAGQYNREYRTIECEKRGKLPSLTLKLGPEDQTVKLSSWDYIQEICGIKNPDGSDWPCFCASMLADGPGFDVHDDDIIVLGSAFLSAFHSVFHLEERSISCKSISAQLYRCSYADMPFSRKV